MALDTTIISASRSYEFRTDDIRLTFLSSDLVVQHIRNRFSFSNASVIRPFDTFGPVPASMPPGLSFLFGITPFPEEHPVSLRFINVEQRRIVIDVAGPSMVLDPTFDYLRTELADVQTLDGEPAIGEPTRTLDFSEIVVRFPFPIDALLPKGLAGPYRRALGFQDDDPQQLVPSFQIRASAPDEEFEGLVRERRIGFLEIRAGTKPEERLFYSAAPLDTDNHIEMLLDIQEAIVANLNE